MKPIRRNSTVGGAGSSTGGLEGRPNGGDVGGVVKAFVLGLVAGEGAADLGTATGNPA